MLIVARGLPGSGKSTWARAFVAEDPSNRVILSRDGFRSLLTGAPDAPHGVVEDAVTVLHRQAVETMLKAGTTVVVDDTNLPFGRVRDWLAIADALDVDYQVKDFTDVPLEECLRRNAARERVVDEQVVRKMHQKFVKGARLPQKWEPKKSKPTTLRIEPYVPAPGSKPAILVDVDGTVALMNGRGPFEWQRVGEDLPNQPIIDHVRAMHAAGYEVIIMSGRLDVCFDETTRWLKEHLQVPFIGPLMRDRTDAPDDEIKLELFNTFVRDSYNVHSVLDDRPRVIRMWSQLGLTVLDVDPTSGEF